MRPFILSVFVSLFLSSCFSEPDFIDSADIEISTDTLLFDTVFTSLGSVSKRLKVYNRSGRDIRIPSISLEGGNSSPYNLIINGFTQNQLDGVELRKGDSLLILANVEIDPTDVSNPFLIEDQIKLTDGLNETSVKLISYGQNVNYISDSILTCNAIWTAEKPYVIYNSVLVDTLCTLNIAAGARIYSHTGSAVFIRGSMISSGTAEEPIIFTNDRLDEDYRELPGQWEGIYFLEGSKNNELNYTTVENSIIGLRVGTPDDDSDFDLIGRQLTIQNCSQQGILAFTSDIQLINTLIWNTGGSALSSLLGGNYLLENCSLLGSSSFLPRTEALLQISDNILLADNSTLEEDLSLKLINSIVWGSNSDEILFSSTGNNIFDIDLSYSLLKTSFVDLGGPGLIFNEEPLFEDLEPGLFLPDIGSPLINSGFDIGINVDITGKLRNGTPDIGAFESVL